MSTEAARELMGRPSSVRAPLSDHAADDDGGSADDDGESDEPDQDEADADPADDAGADTGTDTDPADPADPGSDDEPMKRANASENQIPSPAATSCVRRNLSRSDTLRTAAARKVEANRWGRSTTTVRCGR